VAVRRFTLEKDRGIKSFVVVCVANAVVVRGSQPLKEWSQNNRLVDAEISTHLKRAFN